MRKIALFIPHYNHLPRAEQFEQNANSNRSLFANHHISTSEYVHFTIATALVEHCKRSSVRIFGIKFVGETANHPVYSSLLDQVLKLILSLTVCARRTPFKFKSIVVIRVIYIQLFLFPELSFPQPMKKYQKRSYEHRCIDAPHETTIINWCESTRLSRESGHIQNSCLI